MVGVGRLGVGRGEGVGEGRRGRGRRRRRRRRGCSRVFWFGGRGGEGLGGFSGTGKSEEREEGILF